MRWIRSFASLWALALNMHTAQAEEKFDYEKMTKCEGFNFSTDGTKEDVVKTIMEWSSCIKEQQKARVGKYFCYTSDMVGIQIDAKGKKFVGAIKPGEEEKFLVTISELSDYVKSGWCQQEYGLLSFPENSYDEKGNFVKSKKVTTNFAQTLGNFCLANYELAFSKPMTFSCDVSNTTYECVGALGEFQFRKEGKFVMFKSYGDNSYVSNGQCEKIN
jgi:hypothetical protein